ncbi:acyltransferase family protein [Paenibacillus sp. p3-SID1389]|uniref:acyltransferase family protein n=1 Tax=Paenibacillus sp. p3-SID1389 TaxID=2916364 RepID=UPI0021A79B3C|nr:acyltransferase family protein [Paenibacillus sp. p3-SID1389]MCT2195201.1 acyltransferase family protein [Paenibacillus sp. p3-SID1389]
MTERDYYFDNVKLLLIILVVVGHIIIPLNSGVTFKPLFTLIYSFHMPLFIFISGYFSKNIGSDNYGKRIIANLLIPYLIFETLYSLFDYYLITDNQEKLTFTYLTPYWIMWFLVSMICWKLVLPYTAKIKPWISLTLTIIAGIAIGYAGDVAYYGSISRTIAFFPFFISGFYFDKKWLLKFSHWVYKFISIAILIVAFIVFYQLQNVIKFEFFYHVIPYASFDLHGWRGGIYRLFSYLVAVILGLCVLVLVPKERIPFLSGLGKNTLYAYLLHGFIVKYLHTSTLYSQLDGSLDKFLVVMLGCLIAVVLSTNIIRSIFKWVAEPKIDFLFKDNVPRDRIEEKKNTVST